MAAAGRRRPHDGSGQRAGKGGVAAIGPTEGELVVRVALAAGLGAAVGLERDLTEKAAGIRTHALVALGAAAFTVAGYGALALPDALQLRPDVGRVAAQVASGIGFIGAGLIIFRERRLRGLTTAADLWAVAGIGVLAGLGLMVVATASAGLVVFITAGGRLLEPLIDRARPERPDFDRDGDDREGTGSERLRRSGG